MHAPRPSQPLFAESKVSKASRSVRARRLRGVISSVLRLRADSSMKNGGGLVLLCALAAALCAAHHAHGLTCKSTNFSHLNKTFVFLFSQLSAESDIVLE